MPKYVMALDQGTTSSRAIIFDDKGAIISSGQHDFQQIYPFPGWVEHDPYDILFSQIKAMKDAYQKSGISAKDIAAIGVTVCWRIRRKHSWFSAGVGSSIQNRR